MHGISLDGIKSDELRFGRKKGDSLEDVKRIRSALAKISRKPFNSVEEKFAAIWGVVSSHGRNIAFKHDGVVHILYHGREPGKEIIKEVVLPMTPTDNKVTLEVLGLVMRVWWFMPVSFILKRARRIQDCLNV
jgi:hypothetical protein